MKNRWLPSLLGYCLSKNTICAKWSPISNITTGASPVNMITSLAPTVFAAVTHTIQTISTTFTYCQMKHPNKHPVMHRNHKVDAYTRAEIESVWNIYSCIHNLIKIRLVNLVPYDTQYSYQRMLEERIYKYNFDKIEYYYYFYTVFSMSFMFKSF